MWSLKYEGVYFQQSPVSFILAACNCPSWKLPNRAAWRNSGTRARRSSTSTVNNTYKEHCSLFDS